MEGSAKRNALTVEVSAARMAAPSAWLTPIVGMVIVESAPPRGGMLDTTLSAMITAVAPAICAFFTFTVKVQVPRSIRAMCPVMALAFVMALHPSAGRDAAMVPLIPATVRWGPNAAVLIWYVFATAVGALIRNVGVPPRNFKAAVVVELPSQTTFWSLVDEVMRWPFVIWLQ